MSELSHNPFHRRLAKDKTGTHNSTGVSHRRSKLQEREIAERVQGKITPGSGNQREKGDVRVKGILRIECKTTQCKSFSITRDMISKIEDAALPHGEIPAIVVEFIDADGNPLKEVAVVPTYVLEACNGSTEEA